MSRAERDRTYLQAAITQPLAIATFERAAPAFARALRAERARWSGEYSEWDGALGPAARSAIAALMPHERVFSPTALEHYAACPQQFLMRDVLRVRRVEEPERTVRIDALRRGNLFHRILERFHQEWTGSGPAALAAEAHQRMRAIAEEECGRAEARGETGYPAMWAADRLEVIDDCVRWLEVEREDPSTRTLPLGACEARFGSRRPGEPKGTLSRDEPIEIELAARSLLLAGRIDRIIWDRDPPSRFRVIDYKTGRVRDEKPAQLQGGRMLQLPLYVLAGARAARRRSRRRRGCVRVSEPPGRLPRRSPGSVSSSLGARAQVQALLSAMLDAIARGDFMVAPWDAKKACRFCDLDSVCPVGRAAFVKRKAEDARLARFGEEIRSVE